VRIETPDFPGDFFLIDSDAGAAYFVKPERRTFMDAQQSSILTQIFMSTDPNDRSKQW